MVYHRESMFAFTGKEAYDARLRHCNAWFETNALQNVDHPAISSYFSCLHGLYAPNTVKLTRSAIRASLRVSSIPEGNVLSGIRVRARKSKFKRAFRFTEDELRRFIALAPVRLGLITRFLYSRGVRVDGALGIRLSECRLTGETVVMTVRSKGDVYETSISRAFFNEITDAFRGKTWLFENPRGRKYSRQNFNALFKKYGRRILGRENLSPHKLKHSLCSNLLEQGYTLRQIADLTNTSPENISKYYDLNEMPESRLLSLERIA
jgi:site-specific recombinase XerD